MKLSQYAKQIGVTYQTAFNWFQSGKIPHKTEQLPSGTILVYIEEKQKDISNQNIVIYTRVSTRERKDCLDTQVARCQDFATKNKLEVNKVYKEIASGMNDNRKIFWQMIEDKPTTIIVENKDRLTRFGFTYINNLLLKQNCKILVVNSSENEEQDIIKDMISVVTSFCCRMYGQRRSKNKIKQIKEEILK